MKKKPFLYVSAILLGLMTQSALGMEANLDIERKEIITPTRVIREEQDKAFNKSLAIDPAKDLKNQSSETCLVDWNPDVLTRILSFLDQKSLLRARGISQSWRELAAVAWETKPLNLSNKSLNEEDYTALAEGPFSNLILQKVGNPATGIFILARSSRLTDLDLSFNFNEFNDEPKAAWKSAPAKFLFLRTLNLSSNKISFVGAKKIATIHFPHLTDLDLSRNDLGDEGVKAIAATSFTFLRTLNLSCNQITDVGPIAIAAANTLSALTDLNLRCNTSGPGGAKALAAADFSHLRKLNLRSNCVSNEGAMYLFAANNLSALTDLDLRENFIFLEGAKTIAKGITDNNLPALTDLDLNGNFIGDVGEEEITAAINLRPFLTLSYTPPR